jgi:hypothetical protein
MRRAIVVLIAILTNIMPISIAPAAAAVSPLVDLASADAVLRWINAYRSKPDPAGVPAVVKVLSRLGAFKDPETSGAYVGFMAGVISANPGRAEELIGKMFPLPEADQWAVVRAIAYSGHPEWKGLLRKFAERMPSRQVMIDKYFAGKLPTLYQVSFEDKTSTWDTLRSYVPFTDKPAKDVALEPAPELLDTYWGVYFANGTYRPISRIILMTAWSKDNNSVEKLTLGSMAKYTLASNATRDPALLAMLKGAREHNTKPVVAILDEIIAAAETVETAKLRREALASIEELRRKGPGYKRSVSLWGQVGQGALALGCIAAAATGQVVLGLPCVVAGGVSSAALSYWNAP